MTNIKARAVEIMMSYGKPLWKRLWIHDKKFGGINALVTSPPRTGKTTLLLKGARLLAKRGETVVWRGREVLQIHRLPQWEDLVNIFIHKDDEVKFYAVEGRRYELVELDYEEYGSAEDIMFLAEPGKINVVFEPSNYRFSRDIIEDISKKLELDGDTRTKLMDDYHKSANFWIELGYRLVHRLDDEFWAIFLDEADAVFPFNARGLQWHVHAWAAEQLRDFGKANISLYMAAHKWSEIDARIRNKVMVYLLGPGARAPAGSRVSDDLLATLRLGEFIIDWGRFGLVRIRPLKNVNYTLKARVQPRKEKNSRL